MENFLLVVIIALAVALATLAHKYQKLNARVTDAENHIRELITRVNKHERILSDVSRKVSSFQTEDDWDEDDLK